MDVSCKLTVFFEDPFWVGVYERCSEGSLEAAKIVFGAEPKDYMIFEFLLKEWQRMHFSCAISSEQPVVRKINPKRMQREINQHTSSQGIGTKAQQALKLQFEQTKAERRVLSRENSEAEKQRKFELKQQKKKEKHKGR